MKAYSGEQQFDLDPDYIQKYYPEYYQCPDYEWDVQLCETLIKYTCHDGLGTPYPFKGYVGCLIANSVRYNGGIIVHDKFYKGVIRKLPKLPPGYKIINVISWGLRLVKE